MYNYYPALPPQQVLQANGKASIDALKLSPNSSVLIMDMTAPLVWLCTSDGLGKVTSQAYDISPHITKEENAVESRFEAIERKLEKLMEVLNAKSDDGAARAEPARGAD